MRYSTYHAHTEFCDGRSTARRMILAAIERGCPEIGLSSHSPLPYQNDWSMRSERVDDYISELKKLKKEFEKQIKVYIGVEYDLISPPMTQEFDYVIGSVHHVFAGDSRFDVDHTADIQKNAFSVGFDGDSLSYAENYFSQVAEIYDRTHCDIIGHFDLLLKFNERENLFDIGSRRYCDARNAALERLLQTPAVFEVNTGAISRGYRIEPYPERAVLERIKAAGKPVVVTSDPHSADTVNFLLDETAEALEAQGIHCIRSMDELLSYTRG